jgi:hypothetical protein
LIGRFPARQSPIERKSVQKGTGPTPFFVIFKEIRIEALGLGKF